MFLGPGGGERGRFWGYQEQRQPLPATLAEPRGGGRGAGFGACLNFATFPFFSQREGSVIASHTTAGRGFTSRAGCGAGFPRGGTVGQERGPHRCPCHAPQPLPLPRSLSAALLRLHPGHPPLSPVTGGGGPERHLGTGAGMRLGLLASLCLQGGCSQLCQERFAISSAWLVAPATRAGSGVGGDGWGGWPPVQKAPLLLCPAAGWEGCTQHDLQPTGKKPLLIYGDIYCS